MSARCEHCSAPATLYLCGPCGREMRHRLAQLPWYCEQLETTASRGDQLGELQPIGKSDDDGPMPFNPKASKLLTKIRTKLAGKIRAVCDVRGIEFNPLEHRGALPADFVGPLTPKQWRTPADYTPTNGDLAEWLTYHFASVMMTPDAGEFYMDLEKSMINPAVLAINRPVPAIYRGPCPTMVDEKADIICAVPLYGRRGDAEVTCRRCGKTYDVAEIERALLNEIDDYRWTATEIMSILRELGEPVPKSTFYHWRGVGRLHESGYLHDGRIVNTRIDERDRPVFKLADVRKLRDEIEQQSTKAAK